MKENCNELKPKKKLNCKIKLLVQLFCAVESSADAMRSLNKLRQVETCQMRHCFILKGLRQDMAGVIWRSPW
jgi:hypothetical protein